MPKPTARGRDPTATRSSRIWAAKFPELRLTLPPTAIGKDYLPDGRIFARTPSGTGYQASIAGLLGLIAGGDEGFELNVLGLVTGFDLARPALKLPGIGRVPADD